MSRSTTRQNEPPGFQDFVFSKRPKIGFTIWGVQPGDDVSELLSEMPPNSKKKFTKRSSGREIQLMGPHGGKLELTTKTVTGKETVKTVRISHVRNDTTLELSGRPILRGMRRLDVKVALPGAKWSSEGFEAYKFGQRVRIWCDHHYISDMELTLIDIVPNKSETTAPED